MHADLRRLRFPVVAVATLLVGAAYLAPAAGQAPSKPDEDLVFGTWILNPEKSTYNPGPPPRSQTRTYEAHGEGVKSKIETVDAEGRTLVAEYTANYDSLEYPLSGSAQVDAIALKRISAYRAEATLTHARKVIGTARRIISEDGRTMTITFQGTDNKGRTVDNIAVYEKK